MCERVWRIVQDCAKKQGLVARSRGWLATCKPPECCTCAKHARSWRAMPAIALHDKSPKLARPFACGLNLRLNPTARSSRQNTLFGKNWERNLRIKQDWLIHNLHIETLQIPLLSSSPLLNPWMVHYQNLYSPYPYLWECYLVLWEAVKKGPISYW